MENIGIFACFQRFEPPQTVASAPARRGKMHWPKSMLVDFGPDQYRAWSILVLPFAGSPA
jgi:hypothetical protein